MAEPALPGGELEYAVLRALWDLGSATAREVHDRVGAPADLVYTTIAKVLDRLLTKRLVARRRRGKAFVFRAMVAREEIDRRRTERSIAEILGTAPVQPAVAALVDAVESIDPRLLDELGKAVEERRRSRRGS
jgi:predicted transcriptional regulator